MMSKKLLPFLLLLGLPACAQIEGTLTPQPQASVRPNAPPMTILTDADIADMKRNETLPRPVNYDGQRWHYATAEEKATQGAARTAEWNAQDPELRAAVENKPVEWWGTETPSKPAPRLWWDAKDTGSGVRVQVYDDGQGGMTTTPPSAEPAAQNTAYKPNVPAKAGQPFPLPTNACPNGVCPTGL
ncbi:MAG TPA: hypothetical protein DCW68_05540 [Rhodospirillaceae bacterium]|nr:MAG: hypothetical protein A2018_02115 [Alphaproteobacteria bacterium GWF2_58_20]HAU29558.1 hypothetical protein [Rhodospirillaceae bacterium]